VVVGGEPAGEVAALKTGQVDAFIDGIAVGYRLEQQKDARVLASASSYEDAVLSSVIFASNKLIAGNPDAIRRFLKAWFETIAFMRAHREEAIKQAMVVTGNPRDIEAREFDAGLSSFSATGKFEEKPLAALRHSMVALKIFDAEPDMSRFYTEKFLP
jgi:NitT/TauT family transport system substrate-binding protein